MKKDIHPQYYPNAVARCACGAVFSIGATKPEIEVEICANCHPFYTGKEKITDVAGRVEKFKVRLAKTKAAKTALSSTGPAAKRSLKAQKGGKKPVSLGGAVKRARSTKAK